MYCKNCGNKLENDDVFCTNCGTKKDDTSDNSIVEDTKKVEVNNNEMSPEDTKNANLLCIISLILTFASDLIAGIITVVFPPLGELLMSITPLCNLAGLVLMIVARVKYPKSKFAKILMWIYIGLFIFSIVAIVLIVAACFYACSTMDTSGCN